ncbi:unnamed protein product [Penicillium viridicatum]
MPQVGQKSAPTVIEQLHPDHSATIAIATSLRTVATEKLNLRLVRPRCTFSLSLKVYHRPGRTYRIADALSRLPNTSPSEPKQGRTSMPYGPLRQSSETNVEDRPVRQD